MRTRWIDNRMEFLFSASQIAQMQRLSDMLEPIAHASPIRPEVHDAAVALVAALGQGMAVFTKEPLPLFDAGPDASTAAQPDAAQPDAAQPPPDANQTEPPAENGGRKGRKKAAESGPGE